MIVASSGCTQSLITLPDMPEPDPVKCAKLDMPPAIDRDIHLDIKDGYVESANKGGANLLTNYAKFRRQIKKLWHD